MQDSITSPAIVLLQRQIHVDYIDQLHAGQAEHRRTFMLSQEALDFAAKLGPILPGAFGPLVGDTFELINGVLQRDVRIEAGRRCHHHVGGDFLQLDIRVGVTP
jgi:hypothetical protein